MNEEFPLWAVSAEQQHGLLVVSSVLAVAALLYAAYLARRERDIWPLCVFLGAGLAILLEPLGDIFTQVVYPHVDQVSLFTAWGRKMPLWMGPNYFFFFSVPLLLIVRHVLQSGLTARKWWLSYLGLVVFVKVFEQPGINAGNWKYYGAHAPIAFNSYPIWVGFNNAQCLFSTAVGVYVLRAIGVRGALSVLFALLVPLLIAGTHIAASIPVATATHSSTSQPLIEAAALFTIALNLLMVWVGHRLAAWVGSHAN